MGRKIKMPRKYSLKEKKGDKKQVHTHKPFSKVVYLAVCTSWFRV